MLRFDFRRLSDVVVVVVVVLDCGAVVLCRVSAGGEGLCEAQFSFKIFVQDPVQDLVSRGAHILGRKCCHEDWERNCRPS